MTNGDRNAFESEFSDSDNNTWHYPEVWIPIPFANNDDNIFEFDTNYLEDETWLSVTLNKDINLLLSSQPFKDSKTPKEIRKKINQLLGLSKILKKNADNEKIQKACQLFCVKLPLMWQITSPLGVHLFKVYRYQLKRTIEEERIHRISAVTPRLKSIRNELIKGQKLINLTVSEIKRTVYYLENLIAAIFQQTHFWKLSPQWIVINLFFYSIEATNENSIILDMFHDIISNKDFEPCLSIEDIHTLKKELIQIGRVFADSFISFIIQKLDLPSYSIVELETLLGLRNSTQDAVPVTEPPLYPNNVITPIPTAALMISSTASQFKKELWRPNTDGIACFEYQAKTNPKNYIEHYITSPGDITLLPWDEAQQIIEKFGFTTAKLHLLFAAHSIKQEKPWESKFYLKASDIVREFGWERNHKKAQSEKLLEIATTAFALDCLLVKAVWIEGKNKKGGIDASTPVGRMWNILVEPRGQLNVLTGKVDQPEEVFLSIQPGQWTQHFLNKAGAKSREALYQFGYLAEQVLKIDPYHNELALKLAIHLTLHSRVRLNGKYKVRELLGAALPKTAIEEARLDFRKAYDLTQRWDKALELLNKLRWQIAFDAQTYPEYLRPGVKDKKPKGYFNRLLEAGITIKPPAPIPELLASKSELKRPKAQLKAAVPRNDLTGSQVKEYRIARGWSQGQLALYAGLKGKSLISRIESGQRTITPNMEAMFRQLLDIPD